MSHLDKILDKTFGKNKEELIPPRAPIISETSVEMDVYKPKVAGIKEYSQTDSKPIIASNFFRACADNTDFQRFITWAIKQLDPLFKGITTRDNSQMLTQLNERSSVAYEINKMVRGSKMAMNECMGEFKSKLEMIKK